MIAGGRVMQESIVCAVHKPEKGRLQRSSLQNMDPRQTSPVVPITARPAVGNGRSETAISNPESSPKETQCAHLQAEESPYDEVVATLWGSEHQQ